MLLHRVVCDPGAYVTPQGEVSLNVKRDSEPHKSRDWNTRLDNEPLLPIKTRSFVLTDFYFSIYEKEMLNVEVEGAMVGMKVFLPKYFLSRVGKLEMSITLFIF